MPKAPSGHIFISYSRRDDEVMRKIAFFLRDQGFKVWVDNEKLVSGTPAWEESIENAIKNAFAVIVVLSPEAKSSEWVRREIACADQYQKRVFPVLVKGDEDESLPIRLITRQYIDMRGDETLGLNTLMAAITFYIEKKQTLEMVRPPAQHKPATPIPQRASSSTKWILPTVILLAVCSLALGTLWVGYKIFSVSNASTSAPSDNVAAIPTDIPTEVLSTQTPDQPSTETAVPDISIPNMAIGVPGPGMWLDIYLNDVQIIEGDSFDQPVDNNWTIINGSIENSALTVTGNNNYDGVFRNRDFREGEGIVIDFSYSQDSIFELFMDRGDYNADTYKRFGMYIENNFVSVNERGGGNINGSGFSGDLTLQPDTTYSAFIAILPNTEFMQVIWDPNDPSGILSYREKMDQSWLGLNLTFFIQAGKGTIRFDNYREIKFSGAR